MNIAVASSSSNWSSFSTRPSGERTDHYSSWKISESITNVISQMRQSETFRRLPNSLSEVYRECSRADWDGYGALAITSNTYQEARSVINALPLSMPLPDIVAEPTGEIGFEWRKGKGYIFVVSVGGKYQMTYAGLFGGNSVHGSEYFDRTLPLTVIQHIMRLYS